MEKLTHHLRRLRPSPSPCPSQAHLLGLRGILVISSFLWTFLQVFAPVTVKDSLNTTGSPLHLAIRKTFSVLCWNQSLIYSFFITLSARSICIPFVQNPTSTTVASSAFRRGLRLLIPTTVSLAIVQLVFLGTGHTYIDDFKILTGNISFQTPYKIPHFLAWMNSVFNLFWSTRNFASQAGSTAFPSQTLWIVNVLFSQSHTIFMTMVIIPYTRNSWRVKALLLFILTAWWVQSWAWFSITALLLCDVTMNMEFKAKSQAGLKFWRSFRLPSLVLYGILMVAGLTMQYLWTAWRPQMTNGELRIHANLYDGTDGLNDNYDLREPQARMDNYFFIVGFLLWLETSDFLQYIFNSEFLMYLGRRSFAWFLVQSIIIYAAGIKLYMHLHGNGWSDSGSTLMCLLVCLLTIIPSAEVFFRLVEIPSQIFAKEAFEWIRV